MSCMEIHAHNAEGEAVLSMIEQHAPAPADELLIGEEIAALFRTTKPTVNYWVQQGIGVGRLSFKVGRRRLWRRADVEDYIAAARNGSDAA
jgi:helix-turn-helix protein